MLTGVKTADNCTAMLIQQVRYGNIDILVPRREGAGAGIYRPHLRAKFEPDIFGRKTSEEIEEKIDRIWKTKSAENNRLYNASKFRLAGCEALQGTLLLHFGLTCYKDMCGTNLSESSSSLQAKGAKDFSNKQAYMSDAVGVGLLPVTCDGCLVVTRRAMWTGEYPGALDRPGGHPEPSRIFLPDGSLKPDHAARNIEEAVAQEVWESASQEAVDELGIGKGDIGDVMFLGVTQNLEAGGRPTLEFFARLGVSGERVATVYELGMQAEAEESSSVHLLPPPTLAHLSRLLQPYTLTGGSEKPVEHSAGPVDEDVHFKEARWLLQEATPALRASLILALKNNLLSSSP